MMLLALQWMPQLPQHEYNMANKQVVREVGQVYQFRDISGSTMKCYSNISDLHIKAWKNGLFEDNATQVLAEVLNDIHVDSNGVDYSLTMNATDVNLTMYRVPTQCRSPLFSIVIDGKPLTQEQVQQYAAQGMLSIKGFEHKKVQQFASEKEYAIDRDAYEAERQRLNVSKAFEALPRTSYWRHGSDYLSTNKMSLKKRLVESEVKKIVLGVFEYDNNKTGTIYGICLPHYGNFAKHKCELADFQIQSSGAEIILGCTRLCQLRDLAKSVYNDAFNSAVVVCE